MKILSLGALETGEQELLLAAPAQNAGQPFAADDIAWMRQLAGGLPFFLQMAGFALFEERSREGADREIYPYNQWPTRLDDPTYITEIQYPVQKATNANSSER